MNDTTSGKSGAMILLVLILRLSGTLLIYWGASFVASHFGASEQGIAIFEPLILSGAVAFFFGVYLSDIRLVSHGCTAKESPLSTWKILAIVLWAIGIICLIAV